MEVVLEGEHMCIGWTEAVIFLTSAYSHDVWIDHSFFEASFELEKAGVPGGYASDGGRGWMIGSYIQYIVCSLFGRAFVDGVNAMACAS